MLKSRSLSRLILIGGRLDTVETQKYPQLLMTGWLAADINLIKFDGACSSERPKGNFFSSKLKFLLGLNYF
jgi:hypothetical protein